MNTQALDHSQLDIAAALIVQGELVAFPTETVYGLGASLWNEKAIEKIFQVKGRPADNPLIVHVSTIEQVEELAQDIPKAFYALAEAFWPGPLTCILKKSPHIPSTMTAGLSSIAVRMPAHPLALELIKRVQTPLVAPSANLSGKPSPTQAHHVFEDFNHKIAAVIDGGPCVFGLESSVINLLNHPPRLMRPGVITEQQLFAALGTAVLPPCTHEGAKVLSPGMKYRHYAPACPLSLVFTEQEWNAKRTGPQSKKRLWLVSSAEQIHSEHHALLGASTLYTLLRRADAERYEEIVVFCDHKIQSDLALMNRLSKAVEPA